MFEIRKIKSYIQRCYTNIQSEIGMKPYFVNWNNSCMKVIYGKRVPKEMELNKEYVLVYYEHQYYNIVSIDNYMARTNASKKAKDIYCAVYEILKSYIYEITEKSYIENDTVPYKDFVLRQIEFFGFMDLKLKKYCADDYIEKFKKIDEDYEFLLEVM